MSAAPTATALPPAVPRSPLVISYDITEATSNIDAVAEGLHDDGSNKHQVIRRIRAEMTWLSELLSELEEAP